MLITPKTPTPSTRKKPKSRRGVSRPSPNRNLEQASFETARLRNSMTDLHSSGDDQQKPVVLLAPSETGSPISATSNAGRYLARRGGNAAQMIRQLPRGEAAIDLLIHRVSRGKDSVVLNDNQGDDRAKIRANPDQNLVVVLEDGTVLYQSGERIGTVVTLKNIEEFQVVDLEGNTLEGGL